MERLKKRRKTAGWVRERRKEGVMFLICCGNVILRRVSQLKPGFKKRTRLPKQKEGEVGAGEELREEYQFSYRGEDSSEEENTVSKIE